MKVSHWLLLSLGICLMALVTGCNKTSELPDLPSHVRFLSGMIASDSAHYSYVSLDGQTGIWSGFNRIGALTQRIAVSEGRHVVSVFTQLPGDTAKVRILNAEVHVDPERDYTCVLIGTIPDLATDSVPSSNTALLVADDLHRYQNHLGIRFVNAGYESDTCYWFPPESPDSVNLTVPVYHLQSTRYATFQPGDRSFDLWWMHPSAASWQITVQPGATASNTMYCIGSHKYVLLPQGPHGVLVADYP